MNLSSHFTLEEAVLSQTALRKGIDNTPTPEVLANMTDAASRLEEVRTLLGGAPMHISSWFRCPKLNSAVGGSVTSAHVQGYAIDFVAPGFGTVPAICLEIRDNAIQFDQLIEEGGWVHISFDPKMRQQVLTAHFEGGKATYTHGLTEDKS